MGRKNEILILQYELVRGSRKVLLDYCKTIRPGDFIDQNTSFGRGGSMRNLLVHTANTYQHWIGNIALRKNMAYTAYESVTSIDEHIRLMQTIDVMMEEFLAVVEPDDLIEFIVEGQSQKRSGLTFFSHVITHEYHHKGQILSLSRHMGYIPVDTDIIR